MLFYGRQSEADVFLACRHLELIHLLAQEDRQFHLLQVDLRLRLVYLLEIEQLGHHSQEFVTIALRHLQEHSALIAQRSILR